MSQLATLTPTPFRKSLREWQANYKARQTALAALTEGEAPAAPARAKKLVSRKRRERKPAHQTA